MKEWEHVGDTQRAYLRSEGKLVNLLIVQFMKFVVEKDKGVFMITG